MNDNKVSLDDCPEDHPVAMKRLILAPGCSNVIPKLDTRCRELPPQTEKVFAFYHDGIWSFFPTVEQLERYIKLVGHGDA